MRALLIFAFVACAYAASNITCDRTRNYGGDNGRIYNDACPAKRPYCTGTADVGLCSECAVGKSEICDCPANYKCVAARFNQVRNADFCAPMPLTVIDSPCADANDCAITMVSQQSGDELVAYYASCVNNVCRYCNGRSYSSAFLCREGVVPSGGDARTYGSKFGEARACPEIYQAWNTNTADLDPPLPTDLFAEEKRLYAPASKVEEPSPQNNATTSSGTAPYFPLAAFCALLLHCLMTV